MLGLLSRNIIPKEIVLFTLLIPLLSVSCLETTSILTLYVPLSISILFVTIEFYFTMMQGQDGVDLEINMNGSKSRYEDDDLDNMVFLFSFQFIFLPLFLEQGEAGGGLIFLYPCLIY
jgi:hypothetical protein